MFLEIIENRFFPKGASRACTCTVRVAFVQVQYVVLQLSTSAKISDSQGSLCAGILGSRECTLPNCAFGYSVKELWVVQLQEVELVSASPYASVFLNSRSFWVLASRGAFFILSWYDSQSFQCRQKELDTPPWLYCSRAPKKQKNKSKKSLVFRSS